MEKKKKSIHAPEGFANIFFYIYIFNARVATLPGSPSPDYRETGRDLTRLFLTIKVVKRGDHGMDLIRIERRKECTYQF